jgi:phosphatidylglycerophosphatase A
MEKRANPYMALATCFFVGRIPLLPGTCASFLTALVILLFPFLCARPFFPLLFALFSLFVLRRARPKEKDPREIVIDECAGMFMTMLWRSITPSSLLLGFLAFRAFDILKPFPIRRLERIGGALGILLDDVLAGIYANIVLFLLRR